MRTRPIIAITAASLLASPLLHAQTPAPGQAPAQPAATTTPAPGGTPPAAGGTSAAAAKPLSAVEVKSLTDLLGAMQFHLKMGEIGRGKIKEDKALVDFATKAHKEMTDLYTPLVNYAMNHKVDNKAIPVAVSRGDNNDVEKLGKVKDNNKWKLEYFELFTKNGKRNMRVAETALKTFTDPELKDLATKVSAAITSQTTTAENTHKDLKSKK
jgi:hypothetical protein